MNKNKQNKTLFYLVTILAIIILSGIGYAYFSSGVSNSNNEKINAGTATLSLVFEDNDNGISGNLSLGQSVTKKFTIENTGTVDAYAKINWYNLINTYTSRSLSWVLEQSGSENGTYTSVESGLVPTSSTSTTEILKNGLLIPVNTMYYYKLTITLNNLDVNQNSDVNATMSTYFTLEEGDKSSTGVDTIMHLVGNANTSSTSVITKEAPTGATCTNTLAYDGTVDNNLRYVGANPCNYVSFNNETWRIIGIMNNVNDGTGKTESRIKLIRGASLGNYSWDTSEDSVNNGWGINNWTDSDLNNELNGDYLDTTKTGSTTWYNGWTNQKTGTFNYSNGLKSEAQELIGNTLWYLGGHDTYRVPASVMYTQERSNTTSYEGNPVTTVSKVALMYSSDYGYAVGGSLRDTCLADQLYNYSSCGSEDWITTGGNQWMLTNYSYNPAMALYIYSSNGVGSFITAEAYAVKPVVYLKSNVKIISGDGSTENPYVLS